MDVDFLQKFSLKQIKFEYTVKSIINSEKAKQALSIDFMKHN